MREFIKSIASSKLINCLLAGLWFAIASTIPILFLIVLLETNFPTFGQRRRSIVALSILLSGIAGMLHGSAILDAEKIKSNLLASVRGLTVGLLAYFFLFLVFAIAMVVSLPDILKGLFMISVIFAIGFVMVGWLIAIVGALAGWLLFQLRLLAVEDKK